MPPRFSSSCSRSCCSRISSSALSCDCLQLKCPRCTLRCMLHRGRLRGRSVQRAAARCSASVRLPPWPSASAAVLFVCDALVRVVAALTCAKSTVAAIAVGRRTPNRSLAIDRMRRRLRVGDASRRLGGGGCRRDRRHISAECCAPLGLLQAVRRALRAPCPPCPSSSASRRRRAPPRSPPRSALRPPPARSAQQHCCEPPEYPEYP